MGLRCRGGQPDLEKRMLTMALLDSGMSGAAVARELGCSRQNVEQVKRFFEPVRHCRCGKRLMQSRVAAGECKPCMKKRLRCEALLIRASWQCSTPGCLAIKHYSFGMCQACYCRWKYRLDPQYRVRSKRTSLTWLEKARQDPAKKKYLAERQYVAQKRWHERKCYRTIRILTELLLLRGAA